MTAATDDRDICVTFLRKCQYWWKLKYTTRAQWISKDVPQISGKGTGARLSYITFFFVFELRSFAVGWINNDKPRSPNQAVRQNSGLIEFKETYIKFLFLLGMCFCIRLYFNIYWRKINMTYRISFFSRFFFSLFFVSSLLLNCLACLK